MLVLVIEPTRLYRSMLSTLLADMGFEVVAVENGEQGLAQMLKLEVDLVCTSMHLSDMSGVDVALQLRESHKGNQLPIILLTSEGDKTLYGHALEAGVTEIFHKKDTDKLERYLSYLVYVEDDQLLSKQIVLFLEDSGLKVDVFSNAETALVSFVDNEYALVLTDFLLEGKMSGSELLREIRSLDSPKANVPVLVVSSFDEDSRKLELLKNGANDYISKPIFKEGLIARIRNLIKSQQLLNRLEQQQESLRELAMSDQLTSLYNRHYLFDIAPKRISEAKRQQQGLSVVVIDLDYFKAVNDNYGHATGDMVLKAVGKMLRESVRNEDLVARFGGEEFVALLAHCSIDDALAKAEQFRSQLEALKPGGLTITGSFGVAQFDPERHQDFAQLFNDADKAVYQAKESGRNCVKTLAPVNAMS